MKFSEIPEYFEYINSYSAGNLSSAEEYLVTILRLYDHKLSRDAKAELTRRIGDLKFKQSDVEGAMEYYRMAENEAPDSILVSYQFAKFLLEDISDISKGKQKCDEIIEKISANPFRETDTDFGSEEYLRLVGALRDRFS